MGYLSCRADSSISTCRSISAIAPNSNSQPTISADSSSSSHRHRHGLRRFSYEELAAATSNFSDLSLLGRGSHGSVFKALLPHSSRPLAVKLPSPSPTSSSSDELSILSSLRSPRIVNLLGFSEPLPPSVHPLIIFEYMPNGTLFDLLHSCPRPPSWPHRLRLATQISKALLLLHSSSPVVIHRDVKSANVLIDHDFNARLGDFGLAVQVPIPDSDGGNLKFNSTPPAGTLGYLDPAYVRPENLSTKTDVFSFGILLLEIISGRKAIDVAYSPPSVVDWAVPMLRSGKVCGVFDPRIGPIKDLRARRELAWLAASCVRSRKEKRPSMREVVDRLKVLSKMVSSRAWNGLGVGNPCSVVDTESALLKLNSGNGISDKDWDEEEEEEEELGGGDKKVDSREKKPPPSPMIVKASQPLKNMRKVSDNVSMGRSRNLIDLMNQTDTELIRELAADASAAKGYKISRARTVNASRNFGDKYDVLQLRRNNSVRGVAVKTFPQLKELQNIDAKPHARAVDLT